MNPPLQQTKKWQNTLKSLGQTTFFEEGNDYSFLAIQKQLGKHKSYLYLPYGPYARTKTATKTVSDRLKSLAEEKNVIFIRIEPKDPKIASEWLEPGKITKKVKKSKDLSPKETWVLDLTPEKDVLYKNMKQNTRNLCKNYAKKGITVEKFKFDPKNPEKSSIYIKTLAKLQKQVAKIHNIGAFSEKYLKSEFMQNFATLYVAFYDPKLDKSGQNLAAKKFAVAASLFFDHGDTRFYMQSASDYRYRRLPATYALLNEAIFDAKKKHLKKFDFWGIAPDGADKSHPWAGFTAFKKSFGGAEVRYAGTHDLIRKPAEYHLYEIARKLNRFIRKIVR